MFPVAVRVSPEIDCLQGSSGIPDALGTEVWDGQGRVKGLMNSQGGKRNSSDSRDAVGSHLVEG